MKIYRFGNEVSRTINAFQSDFRMSPIVRQEIGQIHIGCMYLEENGIIGYHVAPTNQLLLIMEGEGIVSGENKESGIVTKGDAVFWEKGEGHETKSEKGLTAIVIEGEELEANWLKEIGIKKSNQV